MSFEASLSAAATATDAELARVLDAHAADGRSPPPLVEATRYALLGGGKRFRPFLVMECAGLFDGDGDAQAAAAAVGAAFECLHAYSLVHDDLPAMDDDDLRRGRPTTHKAYDEATAILVGDGLQALAFAVLAGNRGTALSAEQRLQMIAVLAEAAGSRGMVGGQAVDLESEGRTLTLPELEALHIHKTGAMIRACLLLACHAKSPLARADLDALDRYGKCIGLAFQIQDDILDIEGNSASLGKTAGKDEAAHKSTYPAVMGLPAARQRATELFDEARSALGHFGPAAEPLLWLADHIQGRQH